MTDKFTESYNYEINLCLQLLNHISKYKQTEDMKFGDVKKYLLLFFSEDVLLKSLNKFLLGE